jgi:hypothetical protein
LGNLLCDRRKGKPDHEFPNGIILVEDQKRSIGELFPEYIPEALTFDYLGAIKGIDDILGTHAI